jgi:hypothetical protein
MALPIGSLTDTSMPAGNGMLAPEGANVDVSAPEDFAGGAEVFDDGQGGAIVQAMQGEMDDGSVEVEIGDHFENLAELLDEGTLRELSSELVADYEEDMQSRAEWEEAYVNGLDLLGIKTEDRSQPFEGASGITHPLISESVTQFQSQAYKELLPSGGPVRTQVLGLRDAARDDQAVRVKDFMNYQITEVMEEFDPGLDQMLFYLPLSGSTFKKVYFDEVLDRAVSEFIPAQDLVVPYGATSLASAARITHVLTVSANDIRKKQVLGVFRDVEITETGSMDDDPVDDKVNSLQGTSRTFTDDIHTILEMHVELDLEGFEDVGPDGEPSGIKIPYIVTIEKDSGHILSIRRNYDEGDSLRRKRQYFVHYKFLPGLGFYGFGLIHMIGGLGRAATSILRQLIDAGTLSNLPAGFKARGIRVADSDEPIQPGEWRDIDAPGGNIRDSIIPLPYKEPSATLAQLLGAIIEDGRRFVSIADQQVGNMNQEMPVGTTVALLERGMKVMSAIHKRLHYAQKTEFRLLARILAENLPPVYPYEVAGASQEIKAEDFDGRVDILPVSDPNIFSMAQRVTLAQTQLQLAQSNPQIHNLPAAYRRMYQALEVQNIDEILPPPPEPAPMDPCLENAKALMGEFLKVFPEQDHKSHIDIHIMFLQAPLVQASPAVMGTFYAHLQEHVSMLARKTAMDEIKQAVMAAKMAVQQGQVNPQSLAQYQQQLQQDLQNPVEVENMIVLYEAKLMQELMMRIAPPPPPQTDPLVEIRMQELALKDKEITQKGVATGAELALKTSAQQQQAVTAAARIESQESIAEERNRVNRERIAVQRAASQRKQ